MQLEDKGAGDEHFINANKKSATSLPRCAECACFGG